MQDVEVGRITGAHGLSGQVRVTVWSDVPHRFDPGQDVYVEGRRYRIAAAVPYRQGQLLLSFEGVNNPNRAARLSGRNITVPASESPELPEGEYFHYQLLGLRALTTEGELLGEITEILETGSNDVYVVKGSGGEVLIPALTGVIAEVKLDEGVMLVSLPDGLR